MPFYEFRQNNSGNKIVNNKKVSRYVVFEAYNEQQAISLAKHNGLYFNNFSDEDCSCCGFRWSMFCSAVSLESCIEFMQETLENTVRTYTIVYFLNGERKYFENVPMDLSLEDLQN